MTENARAAIVFAAAARALIRAMGMEAENAIRLRRGEALAYDGEAYERLLVEEGIGHNQVMEALRP